MGDASEISFGYPRWCFAAGAVLCAVGLALSGWLAPRAGAAGATVLLVMCAAWLAGLAVGTAFTIRWRPVWRVGPEGIAVLGAGTVAWNEVASVGPLRGTAVRIALRDPRTSSAGRLSVALRNVPLCSPFTLGLGGLNAGRDDIRRAVELHAPGRWRSPA